MFPDTPKGQTHHDPEAEMKPSERIKIRKDRVYAWYMGMGYEGADIENQERIAFEEAVKSELDRIQAEIDSLKASHQ